MSRGDVLKGEFTAAYDDAASRRAPVASDDDDRAAKTAAMIHRCLMQKMGYADEQLDFLGDAARFMQGVGNVHPTAAIRDGESVLDLGSGYGCDALLAARAAGVAGRVTGVDLSSGEVEAARELAASRGLGEERVRFVVGDVERLPIADASVDVVVSNGAFCLVPDKPRAFAEVARVLKPGGRMAVACTTLRVDALDPNVKWPTCMEVFVPTSRCAGILAAAGLSEDIVVDATSNSAMAVEVGEDDLAALLEVTTEGGCTHARRAARRRLEEANERVSARQRDRVGVHWGDPQYAHLQQHDMDALCARTIISARKPRAALAASPLEPRGVSSTTAGTAAVLAVAVATSALSLASRGRVPRAFGKMLW